MNGLCKSVILTFALMASMGANGQESKMDFVISGTLPSLPDSSVVELQPISHQRPAPIAQAVAYGGKFELKGSTESNRGFYLRMKGTNGILYLVLDNPTITLSGDVSVTHYPKYVDCDYSRVSVEGSPLTAKFQEKLSAQAYCDSMYAVTRKASEPIMKQIGEAYQAKDQAKIDSLKQTPAYKEAERNDGILINMTDSMYTEAVLSCKDNFMGPLLMEALYVYFTPQMRPLYQAFSTEAKNSYYGKMIYNELYPMGEVGDKFANIVAKDSKGNTQSLYDITKANKYVLVDFWASWCGPCRREIPNIKKIYEKHRSQGFDVISISIDKKEKDWRKALAQEGLTWTNIWDSDGKIAKEFHVSSIPAIVILDSNAQMVSENLRGEELANKIDELMSK